MTSDMNNEIASWILGWPDGLLGVDSESRVMFVSQSASAILGWTESDIQGKHLHDVLCVNSRGHAHTNEECPLDESAQDDQRTHSTVWQKQSGHHVSVDYRSLTIMNGQQVHRVISFQGNVEAEHSQNELDKFAEYVDKSPEPIAEFDGEGQMIFGNPAMQDQMIEGGFNEQGTALIFPDSLAQICSMSMQNQEVVRGIEVQVEGRWYRWQFHPLDSAGYTSIMGYAFDITDQKNMELCIEAEKANARRDFFAKMVHELRTPLNAIIGFSQVLIRRTENIIPERDLRHLSSIRAAGLQLNEMISDTLDISKIDAGKMSLDIESFQMMDVVDSFHEQIHALADAKQLSFIVDCESDIGLESDIKKVRQTIVNLLSNSVKYTPSGHVILAVSQADDPQIGASIQIDVSDTGIGIPQEQIDSLFVAYEQVSTGETKGIQGTGLGLALVSELVDMLKGRICVSSVKGVGSTFSVFLPKSCG